MNSEELNQIPVRLYWAGWESNTYTLRAQGWAVYVNEQIARHSYEKEIQLAVKSPDNKLLIMGEMRVRPEMLFGHNKDRGLVGLLMGQGIKMQTYRSCDIVVRQYVPETIWQSFDTLETSDGFASVSMSDEHKALEEFKIFRNAAPSKEIFIPYNTVDQCLNQILTLQRPEQLEIKKGQKIMRPEYEARIYALAA